MRKLIAIIAITTTALTALARPAPARAPHRPAPVHHHHQHHVHHAPVHAVCAAVGGFVAGLATATVRSTPVVVRRTVWVDGYWTETKGANGVIVRTWVPGYWTTVEEVVR